MRALELIDETFGFSRHRASSTNWDIPATLVYLFVIEAIIGSFRVLSEVHKWLPGGALQALTESGQGADVLNSWQGGLLLLGYGLVAALLGTLLAVRRDVT